MKWSEGRFLTAVGRPFAPWSTDGHVVQGSPKSRAKLSCAHLNRAQIRSGKVSDCLYYGIHEGDDGHVLTHLSTGAYFHVGTEQACMKVAEQVDKAIKELHANFEGASVIPIEPLIDLVASREKVDAQPAVTPPPRRRRVKK